eukprot:TRINITY_DN2280_c0_g1_i1.p2 TRINITY_DN2280_c0_g1~~TRINITY_DN2280_c0_g1_i1.p2  ORF type:complete len:261 (-),score=18.74 TRINITY_DN2280_c0_g1_i1:300-1082(-)
MLTKIQVNTLLVVILLKFKLINSSSQIYVAYVNDANTRQSIPVYSIHTAMPPMYIGGSTQYYYSDVVMPHSVAIYGGYDIMERDGIRYALIPQAPNYYVGGYGQAYGQTTKLRTYDQGNIKNVDDLQQALQLQQTSSGNESQIIEQIQDTEKPTDNDDEDMDMGSQQQSTSDNQDKDAKDPLPTTFSIKAYISDGDEDETFAFIPHKPKYLDEDVNKSVSGDKLSKGQIAGIVVGSVMLIGLLITAAWISLILFNRARQN